MDDAPFILTLILDPVAQARFDALRTEHFPREKLVVGAHVTLFHALPRDLNVDVVAREAARSTFPVQVKGVLPLGRGVAFELESAALLEMRACLRDEWLRWLTPQDRHPWRPHVTVQNKVEPAVARALFEALSTSFVAYEVLAVGLALWIYRNGPWEAAGRFGFQKEGTKRSSCRAIPM